MISPLNQSATLVDGRGRISGDFAQWIGRLYDKITTSPMIGPQSSAKRVIADAEYGLHVKRLVLEGKERLVVEGSGRLVICG